MIDTILGLPSHQRKRIAKALSSGLLSAPYSRASVLAAAGIQEGADAVIADLACADSRGINAQTLASMIECYERMMPRNPDVDLVWSGPEAAGLYSRDTPSVPM